MNCAFKSYFMNCTFKSLFMKCAFKSSFFWNNNPHFQAYLYKVDKYAFYFVFHMARHNPTRFGVKLHTNCADNSSFMNCAYKSFNFVHINTRVQAYFYVVDKYNFQVIFHMARNTHPLRVILDIWIVSCFTSTFRVIFWKC